MAKSANLALKKLRKHLIFWIVTGRLVSSCRNLNKSQVNNFKHNRNWRKNFIVKNMIASFKPNIPENCSRKKVHDSTLARFQRWNPSSPKLCGECGRDWKLRLCLKKTPNTSREITME